MPAAFQRTFKVTTIELGNDSFHYMWAVMKFLLLVKKIHSYKEGLLGGLAHAHRKGAERPIIRPPTLEKIKMRIVNTFVLLYFLKIRLRTKKIQFTFFNQYQSYSAFHEKFLIGNWQRPTAIFCLKATARHQAQPSYRACFRRYAKWSLQW